MIRRGGLGFVTPLSAPFLEPALKGSPRAVVLDFERSGIHFHLDLYLAAEPGWYSPRVPADAASAILELILVNHPSRLVHQRERRGGQPDAIFADARQVSFSRLPFYGQSD